MRLAIDSTPGNVSVLRRRSTKIYTASGKITRTDDDEALR